jgi:sugar lactone lactonase YvrE
MRRILLAVLILILPTATAVGVYLIVNKRIPTNRNAIGLVTTIAGAGQPGVQDGPAISASFSDPFGIAVDKRGNVYVADGGESNRIRRLTPEGKVETVAGSTEGFADGNAAEARFNTPSGIAIDRAGNLLIADTSNNRIRKLSADGRTVSTIAGSGAAGFTDGFANEAEFNGPIGIAVDRHGNIFVADSYNDKIREISAGGTVTTIAGGDSPGYTDGQASSTLFDTPCGVAVDETGNIFVVDTGNRAVRKITPQGDVSTVAGGINEHGDAATDGEVHYARPVGIAITHDGFLFVSDEQSRVSVITPEGEAKYYAGWEPGFADDTGFDARFNRLAGIAVDRRGTLYVADGDNYLIRELAPTARDRSSRDSRFSFEAYFPNAPRDMQFIQPLVEGAPGESSPVIPRISASSLNIGPGFPWPLSPQDRWHEIAGVIGEARGAPAKVALDHIHSGLDIHGSAGEPALSVYAEKVTSPIANWGFEAAGEGTHIGLFSYIHVRIGRNAAGEIQTPETFTRRSDSTGKVIGVRLRRGTRFKVGDFIGSLNRLNHVHLNFGPSNAETNPLALPFFGFKDTVAPAIEPHGIEVVSAATLNPNSEKSFQLFTQKQDWRLIVSGDVAILVTAYDRIDGNIASRKLGLYRLGYQLLDAAGRPVKGFAQPLINIEFSRLPADPLSVFKAYAAGSGVSAYGTPTNFRYIVTNRIRDGEARDGLLRTSELAPGNYIIKVTAEDFAGNRASGPSTELAITVKN